jgi:predicted small lipoprotein YifL
VKHAVLICAALVPLLMTTACGQKGALYLPPRNGTVVTRPAPAATDQPPTAPQAPGSGQPDKKNKDENPH